jgi:hypothetical protein
MQLINKAASGYIPALRTYVDRYEKALAKAAQLEAAKARYAENTKMLVD